MISVEPMGVEHSVKRIRQGEASTASLKVT